MADEIKDTAKRQETNPVAALATLVVLGLGAWFYFGGGLEQQAAENMREIEKKVAIDAVRQYDIAKRNGTAIDACVQAGMVSAAFLQANDEPNYAQWKQTEKSDCAAAGLPK